MQLLNQIAVVTSTVTIWAFVLAMNSVKNSVLNTVAQKFHSARERTVGQARDLIHEVEHVASAKVFVWVLAILALVHTVSASVVLVYFVMLSGPNATSPYVEGGLIGELVVTYLVAIICILKILENPRQNLWSREWGRP